MTMSEFLDKIVHDIYLPKETKKVHDAGATNIFANLAALLFGGNFSFRWANARSTEEIKANFESRLYGVLNAALFDSSVAKAHKHKTKAEYIAYLDSLPDGKKHKIFTDSQESPDKYDEFVISQQWRKPSG